MMIKKEERNGLGEISLTLLQTLLVAQVLTFSRAEECNRALGMENRRIVNSQLSASSEWDSDHGPRYARLNLQGAGINTGRRGGWSARALRPNQWLKVDFRFALKVTGIETQGRQDCCDQWVTNYTVSYSQDDKDYHYFQQNGQVKVFPANKDRNSIVRNTLSPPIMARYVRIHPTTWNKHISMRAEFRGCLNITGLCTDEFRKGLTPSCYSASSQSVTWNSAREECVKIGGDLAVLNSKDKNQLIHEKFLLDGRLFWIGLRKKNDSWLWIDGALMNYTQWKKGEPNNYNGNNEGCGEYDTNEKGWNDEQCQRNRRFICSVTANESFDLSGQTEFRINQQRGASIQVQGYYDFCSRTPLACDDCRRVLCVTAGSNSTNITPVVYGRTIDCRNNFSVEVEIPYEPGNHKIRLYRTLGNNCKDGNDEGPSKDVGLVHVEGPPVVRNVLLSSVDNEILRTIGQEVSLLCDVNNNSRVLYYTWFKDGVLLSNHSSAQVLVITLKSQDDFGYYKCEVRNRAGVARKTIKITRKIEANLSALLKRKLLPFYCTTGVLSASVLVLLLILIKITVGRSCHKIFLHGKEKQCQLVPHSLTRKTDQQTDSKRAGGEVNKPAAVYSEALPVEGLNFKTKVYEDLHNVEEQRYHSLDHSTNKNGIQEKVVENSSTPVQTSTYYEIVVSQKTEELEEEQYLNVIP